MNPPKPPLILRGSRVELRRFLDSDLTDDYIAWLNDPQVVRFSNQRFRPHDRESCERYLATFDNSPNLFFSVRMADTGRSVGTMTAYLAPQHGTADVGIMIGDRSCWGQGLGQDAWNTLAAWLLQLKGVRKLTAGTLACNASMLHIMERCGMHVEGIRKQQEIADGRAQDIVYCAKFATPELPASTAVVCHDAGAANLILAWLKASMPADCRLVLAGPARSLYQQTGLTGRLYQGMDEALAGAHMLLSGTGWSDLEHDARTAARAAGLHSVAVIDHWVNYPDRFERNNVCVLPDEFWVTDSYARDKAACTFPGAEIRVQPNLYLEQTLREIGPKAGAPCCLYLLEPVRSQWGRTEDGEFQALDYFAQNLGRAGVPSSAPVRLRLHPSEEKGKYDAWLARHGARFALDDSTSLAAAIGRAHWVAGCETAAMVIALAAGRSVICTIPPWAPPCRLPHRGLFHLSQVAASMP